MSSSGAEAGRVDPYVRRLLASDPLDADREHALATRAAAGDRAARDELIVGSLRMVALRARMFGFGDSEIADAVQAGTVGLIRAVDRFDPQRGVRLATFSWWWIGAAMRTAVRPGAEVPVGHSSDLPVR